MNSKSAFSFDDRPKVDDNDNGDSFSFSVHNNIIIIT